jgi:hypothetical protein
MKNEFTPMTLAFRDSLRHTYRLDTANAELDRMMDHAIDALDDHDPLGDLFDDDQPEYDGEIDGEISPAMIPDLYVHGGYETRLKIDRSLREQRERERSSQERSWWKW